VPRSLVPPPPVLPAAGGRERQAALALLRRFGWNVTSFQVLEPGLSYWFADAEACVAYVDTGRSWVAAGEPICAEERLRAVAEAFVAEAQRHGRRACFFAAEGRLLERTGLAAMHVGEQPVWDPAAWEEVLRGSRSLREQLRRARAKGVQVRPVPPGELSAGSPTRAAVEALVRRWESAHAMPPMGFLVQLAPFDFVEQRRFFLAEQEGRVVGMLAAVPIFARGGWFFEDLLREPHAPNGTAELLVDAGMRAVAGEGSRFVTMGLAPLSGEVSGWLRAVRQSSRDLYDFEGLRAFKGKLKPSHWDAVYVAHPGGQWGAVTLLDVLAAFARGGLLRFGLATLMRGPALVLRALAALLILWTATLALAPASPWFPAATVKWAWVAFDVAVAAGLFSLLRRWRRGLASALLCLIGADAVLTLLQALTFNMPRARGLADAALLALAVAGPTAAAFMLWQARAHRERAA
jgi:phosphatidylglycerol lysyltransferase